MLEAALTVVDGCPAGAAAVVPEGVRAAVVVPEDAAVAMSAALHTQRETRRRRKSGYLHVALHIVKFQIHRAYQNRGVLFPAFFSYISCFSEVAKAEGFLGTRDQKGRAR